MTSLRGFNEAAAPLILLLLILLVLILVLLLLACAAVSTTDSEAVGAVGDVPLRSDVGVGSET
jgi:hypothetical protein